MSLGIVEIYLIAAVVAAWIGGNIARKAGFSRWFGLLLLVPLVNLIVVWIFAFTAWPVEGRK